MATKEKKPATKANSLQVTGIKGESQEQGIARTILRPSLAASTTVLYWSHMPSQAVDQTCLVDALTKQSELVSAGDLSRGEVMRMSQAHALDAIFNKLAVVAKLNLSQNLEATDTLLRLALRAQAQARATIETLAEIKNPTRATFVRQANITHGPQQVNNGSVQAPRAAETEVTPNKLLEQIHGERLDIETAGQAIGSDPAMAAVGTINGAVHD